MRRGYTLIEVLISGGLSALLMGIILLFLFKGMQSFSVSQEESEIHEATLIGMHSLTGMMEKSEVQSVQINPTNPQNFPGVAFVSGADDSGTLQFVFTLNNQSNVASPVAAQANHTTQGPNNNGTTNDSADTTALAFNRDGYILWQRYVVYYYDTHRRALCEQEIKLPTPTVTPNPLQLPSFTPSSQDRAVALNIDSFNVSFAGTAQTNPVNVTISAKKIDDTPHGTFQPHVSTLTSSVVLENGFFTSGALNFSVFFSNRLFIQPQVSP